MFSHYNEQEILKNWFSLFQKLAKGNLRNRLAHLYLIDKTLMITSLLSYYHIKSIEKLLFSLLLLNDYKKKIE